MSEVASYCFVTAMISCCIAVDMPSAVEGCLSSGYYHAGDRDHMLPGCCSQRGTVDALYAYLMSQCRHALWQDIWQVRSLDGLWIQYTQAE